MDIECRICGMNHGGVEYRQDARQYLCRDCYRDTPAKIGREEFDRAYWSNPEDVPASTKREFYSDYLASTHDLKGYIKATTTPA